MHKSFFMRHKKNCHLITKKDQFFTHAVLSPTKKPDKGSVSEKYTVQRK